MVRILLVRHGVTSWNVGEKRFRGQLNVDLSEEGKKQADAAGKILQKEPIEAIFYSPMTRTKQTAEEIAKYKPKIPCTEEQLLIDISFGDWQGRTHKEVFAERPGIEENWYNYPERLLFPNGETWFAVYDRIDRLFKRLRKAEEKTVVLVTHRVVCNIVLLYLLGLSPANFWSFNIDTASITEFFLGKDGQFTIAKVNDKNHLKGPK